MFEVLRCELSLSYPVSHSSIRVPYRMHSSVYDTVMSTMYSVYMLF